MQDSLFVHGNRESHDPPTEFLRRIVSGQKYPVDLTQEPLKPFLARLKRAKDTSLDERRATGHWPLVLAWPLVYVPRADGATPYYAPLFTWKINIRIEKGIASFSRLRESGAEFNFMLQAGLEHVENFQLSWEEDENENADLDALVEKIRDTFARQWDRCELPNFSEGYVRAYSEEFDGGQAPKVIPCAVIGRAGFRYRPLLEDLKRLENELQGVENPEGLLGKMLAGDNANPDAEADYVPEPPVTQRWLVTEQSDPIQEESVWQARHEKVMLIKGPPGTGKSQTIVNLIADAVKRKKTVALVCQKKPALDVVRKRLEEATLADLVAQVDEPKNSGDRRAIIKRITGITADGEPMHMSDRTVVCRRIDKNEKKSANLPENEGLQHSVRGDLRAKIFRVRESTGFDAFHPDNRETINAFSELLGHQITQTESDRWHEKSAKLAEKWGDTDYPNNPWHSIKNGWQGSDDVELVEFCRVLQGLFADLALEVPRACLSRDMLVFAESPIMTGHFSKFFGSARRDVVCKLCDLIARTKKNLFEFAGMECDPIWEKLFDSGAHDNPFDRYQENIQHIGSILGIRAELRDTPVLQLLADKFPEQVPDWADILLAIISKLRFDHEQMRFDFRGYKAAVDQLRRDIHTKLQKDRRAVLSMFNERVQYRRNLERRNLLRLNKTARIPRTQLRDLYGEGGGDPWKIHPVLLTNPNALCQIVPWKKECVDTVIIDEASQMFTADALPVFYRAKKVFVCGDQMQMPPSDFFAARLVNDEFDDGAEEGDTPAAFGNAPAEGRFELLDAIERLLLTCPAACRQLNIHYRSRPSELIAFSSHAFYDGKLQAAPNNAELPECAVCPIEVIEVGGAFERGVNHDEIDAVINKLDNIWAMQSPPSVGVITFNVRQERELYDAIREKAENDQDFAEKLEKSEQKMDGEEDVGFFIRSVENVQGDERDIIILSTTYGPKQINYGPLSRSEKGRRRLNVAITRARLGMVVITSLSQNISNLGEDPRGEGGRERWYLWMYMRYARAVSSGDSGQAKEILQMVNPQYQPQPSGKQPDSDFEVQVADFLRGSGYHVDYQIGESGFRIDLGIKHKKSDPMYLCGVECDGREWHSGWRARHNDIWRQRVLEEKGWKIVRIWSDEWFPDPRHGGELLLDRIKTVRTNGT